MTLSGPPRGLAMTTEGMFVVTAAVTGLPPDMAPFVEHPVDCQIVMWDGESGKQLDELPARNVIRFSLIMNDYRTAWLESGPNRVGLWLSDGTPVAVEMGRFDVTLAPEGNKAIALDHQARQAIRFTLEDDVPGEEIPFPPTERLFVTSPDATRGMGIDQDGMWRGIDLSNGRWFPRTKRQTDRRFQSRLSADDQYALECGSEVALWNLITGDCLVDLNIDPSTVTALALTADARVAAIGAKTGEITLWRLPAGQLVDTFTADSSILMLALAENGSRVAAVDAGSALHILAFD